MNQSLTSLIVTSSTTIDEVLSTFVDSQNDLLLMSFQCVTNFVTKQQVIKVAGHIRPNRAV